MEQMTTDARIEAAARAHHAYTSAAEWEEMPAGWRENQIRAMAAALAAADAAAWQPIEDALQDGRLSYLGMFPNGRVERIWWDKDQYAKRPHPFWNNAWHAHRVSDARASQPTRFMPLPTAHEVTP